MVAFQKGISFPIQLAYFYFIYILDLFVDIIG